MYITLIRVVSIMVISARRKRICNSVNVCITGAASRSAYSLIHLIVSGAVFGKFQRMTLYLLETPEKLSKLNAIIMELADCIQPLVHNVIATSVPELAFRDVEAVFLLASKSDHASQCFGVTRATLEANIRMYRQHAIALDRYARKNVKVLVMSQPVNTLTLVCMKYAPTIQPSNFSALNRQHVNRSIKQVAMKLKTPCENISNVLVWGYHWSHTYIDCSQALVKSGDEYSRLPSLLRDPLSFQDEISEIAHKRARKVWDIADREPFLCNAIAGCDQMRSWWSGTPTGEIISMSVISDGSYGIAEDIVYSFPVKICQRRPSIISFVPLDAVTKKHIFKHVQTLIERRGFALEFMSQLDIVSPLVAPKNHFDGENFDECFSELKVA